ncbi:MAG: hypothetical protein IH863_03850 [Chloroflexi bacterium]|nr:hypothetical protein [Chloroflexota bacterium]
MAAPEGHDAAVNHVWHETGCLRIMQDDDIAAPDPSDQILCVLGNDSFIDLASVLAERRTVSHGSMERVMEAFGHDEEVVSLIQILRADRRGKAQLDDERRLADGGAVRWTREREFRRFIRLPFTASWREQGEKHRSQGSDGEDEGGAHTALKHH